MPRQASGASADRPVAVEQLPLTRVLRHFATLDEDVLGPGGELEGIAGPYDDVRVLPRFERSIPGRDAPDLRGCESDGAQRGVAIETVSDGVPGLLAEVAGVVSVERRQNQGRAGL